MNKTADLHAGDEAQQQILCVVQAARRQVRTRRVGLVVGGVKVTLVLVVMKRKRRLDLEQLD